MLVLTRKQNEKIRIGDSIVITVLKTKGKGVRLGIEAPSDVNILRGEIAFEMPAERAAQSNASTSPVRAESVETKQAVAAVRPSYNHGSADSHAQRWPLEKSLNSQKSPYFPANAALAESPNARVFAQNI